MVPSHKALLPSDKGSLPSRRRRPVCGRAGGDLHDWANRRQRKRTPPVREGCASSGACVDSLGDQLQEMVGFQSAKRPSGLWSPIQTWSIQASMPSLEWNVSP